MNHQENQICNEIYEMYRERLNWYMRKTFPRMNPEDWHDVQQDVWQKLSEHIALVQTLSPPEQFEWLTKVCRNQAVSLVRKQKRLVDTDIEIMEKLQDSTKTKNLEDEVVIKMMFEELLKKLPEKDREFLLKNELSKSKNKRKRNNAEACKLYRIKQKLRKLWKDGGWDE